MEFKNKVVWITGASSGIGEYMAYELAKEGATLYLSSRNAAELERVKAACAPQAKVEVLPLDISDFEAVEKAGKNLPKLDLLINNAGISQRDLAANTHWQVDKKVMDVNYMGSVVATKSVLGKMIQEKSGHIVVISSVMGKIGAPYRSAYAASKHALHGFFDSLRAEVYAHKVQVTVICPGYVNTNVTINALKGDGSTHQIKASSTANGLPPTVFAKKAIRAIKKGKKEVLIGQKEVLAVYIMRWAPKLFFKIARNLKLN